MLANTNIYVVSSTMIMPLDDREDAILKVNQKNPDTVTETPFSKSERKQYANDQHITKDDKWYTLLLNWYLLSL